MVDTKGFARSRNLALLGPVLAGALSAAVAHAAPPPAAPPCSTGGYHQFDFWLGDWDVFDVGGADKVATAVISPVQGGCGLREQYRGVDGGAGESLTMYDPSSGLWRQAWVSNRGQIVIIEGARHGAGIVLEGPEYGGAPGRRVRGSWTPAVGGAVREIGERSVDGGRTWTRWFDIVFRPKPAS